MPFAALLEEPLPTGISTASRRSLLAAAPGGLSLLTTLHTAVRCRLRCRAPHRRGSENAERLRCEESSFSRAPPPFVPFLSAWNRCRSSPCIRLSSSCAALTAVSLFCHASYVLPALVGPGNTRARDPMQAFLEGWVFFCHSLLLLQASPDAGRRAGALLPSGRGFPGFSEGKHTDPSERR